MTKDDISNLFTSKGKLDSNKIKKIKIPIEYNWVDTKPEFLFCLNNDIFIKPQCYCGNNLKFHGFKNGYSKYCSSKCSNKSPDKIKKFIENVSQIQENGLTKAQNITNLAQQTSFKKYGMRGYNNREKSKNTKLNLYGDENYNNYRKAEETNLKKYNVNHFYQSLEFKEKSKNTKLNLYGDENYNNYDKMKNTCLELYGVDNVRYSTEINKKIQIKRRKTMEDKGTMTPLSEISEYKKYKKEVWKYTSKNDLTQLKNIDKRGMAGKDNAYHLDHKIPIIYGFKNNINPQIIGNIKNLHMIPWKENYQKNGRIDENIAKEILCKILEV